VFDNNQFAKEMYNLSKNYWTTTMEMLSSFQDQNEKMFHTMIDHGLVAQQEGKKMLQEWMSRTRKAQDQFTQTMQDTWEKTGLVFGTTPKSGK